MIITVNHNSDELEICYSNERFVIKLKNSPTEITNILQRIFNAHDHERNQTLYIQLFEIDEDKRKLIEEW